MQLAASSISASHRTRVARKCNVAVAAECGGRWNSGADAVSAGDVDALWAWVISGVVGVGVAAVWDAPRRMKNAPPNATTCCRR